MLFIVQYPVTDLRALFPQSAGRLDDPEIRDKHPGKNFPDWLGDHRLAGLKENLGFVRSFGRFGSRRAGGVPSVAGIFGESNACDCRRAIRFHEPIAYVDPASGRSMPMWVTFRRFYFDGFATGRIEIGITDHRGWKKRTPADGDFDLASLIKALSAVRVSIHDDFSDKAEDGLFQADRPLTMALLSATSAHKSRDKAIPDLIDAGFWIGKPSLYIRCAANERIQSKLATPAVSLVSTPRNELRMHRYLEDQWGMAVWIQNYDAEVSLTELAQQRDLRLLLSRLNAEQQSIARFEELVAQGTIHVGASGAAANFYDKFMEISVLRLKRLKETDEGYVPEIETVKALAMRAGLGSWEDLAVKIRQLDNQPPERQTEKRFWNYALDMGKTLVELVLKVYVEARIKGAMGGAG